MKPKKVKAADLLEILRPYDKWNGSKASPQNLEAKAALQKVLAIYRAAPLSKELIRARFDTLLYSARMAPLRVALRECYYLRACNELMTIIHNENVFKRNIHMNLVLLLDYYLSESN